MIRRALAVVFAILLWLPPPAFALSTTQKLILLFGGQHISFTPPLDVLPSAGAAYSVRCLRSAYCLGGGYDMDIRRASDNAQQIVGFVGGNLNTGLVSSFCANTTCYVSTLYDQSVNGRNATQTTAASQPQLVLNAIGGRPALQFSGSQYLATASFTVETAPASVAAVAERTGAFTSLGVVASLNGSTDFLDLLFAAAANEIEMLRSASVTASAADGAAHSFIAVFNAASSVLTVDGADTTGNPGGPSGGSGALVIGASNGGGNALTGYLSEEIVWTSLALSSSQRSAVHTNQSAYYGTP